MSLSIEYRPCLHQRDFVQNHCSEDKHDHVSAEVRVLRAVDRERTCCHSDLDLHESTVKERLLLKNQV